jgi:hypothetical protein
VTIVAAHGGGRRAEHAPSSQDERDVTQLQPLFSGGESQSENVFFSYFSSLAFQIRENSLNREDSCHFNS